MVKKIKKNSSYSYNDRNIKPSQNTAPAKIDEELLDITADDASYAKRIGAYIVDLCLYVPLAILFQYTTTVLRAQGGAENERNALYMTLCIVIYAVLMFGYLPNKWQGQTIGKKIFKLRIVPTNGRKLEFSKYLVREFLVKITIGLFVVPAVVIVYIYNKYIKKQDEPELLHDYLMSTRVVVATEEKIKK